MAPPVGSPPGCWRRAIPRRGDDGHFCHADRIAPAAADRRRRRHLANDPRHLETDRRHRNRFPPRVRCFVQAGVAVRELGGWRDVGCLLPSLYAAGRLHRAQSRSLLAGGSARPELRGQPVLSDRAVADKAWRPSRSRPRSSRAWRTTPITWTPANSCPFCRSTVSRNSVSLTCTMRSSESSPPRPATSRIWSPSPARSLAADLFIDCSGFASLLDRQAFRCTVSFAKRTCCSSTRHGRCRFRIATEESPDRLGDRVHRAVVGLGVGYRAHEPPRCGVRVFQQPRVG